MASWVILAIGVSYGQLGNFRGALDTCTLDNPRPRPADNFWYFRLPVLGNEIHPLVLGGALAGCRHWPPKAGAIIDARDRAGVV